MQNDDVKKHQIGRLEALRASIGHRLRKVRESMGDSQSRFGERLGVTKLSVANYEAGKTSPSVDLLASLELVGVDAQFIAFGLRSLATQEARAQFAAVHAWVRRECRLRATSMTDEAVMDVAWSVFSRLSEQYIDHAPDAQKVRAVVLEAFSQTS